MPNISAAPPAPGDPATVAAPDLPRGTVPFQVAPGAPDAVVVTADVRDTLPAQAPPAPDAGVVPADTFQGTAAPAAGASAPAAAPAPTGSGATVEELTATSATVVWTTQVASRGRVEYGTDETYGQTTPQEASNTFDHRRQLTGLTPGTDYRFRATAGEEISTGTFRTPDA